MNSPNTRKPYKTDVTDEQWELLHPQLVLPEGGRPKPPTSARWSTVFSTD